MNNFRYHHISKTAKNFYFYLDFLYLVFCTFLGNSAKLKIRKICERVSEQMTDFSHFNTQGRAKMVDISEKQTTARTAMAKTSVQVNQAIYEKSRSDERRVGKERSNRG